MRHKRWIALVVLPAVLLAGDFVYWRLAVTELREEFDRLARRAQDSGWRIGHGAITAGGWPDAATLRVKNLTVTAPGPRALRLGARRVDNLALASEAVLLTTGLTRPGGLEVAQLGAATLRLNNGPAIKVSADHMYLRLNRRPDASPRTAAVDVAGLAAEIPGSGTMRVGSLSGHTDFSPDAGRDQPAVSFAVSAKPVALPAGTYWGLGPEIGELTVEGVLNGRVASAVFTGRRDLATEVTSWRDEGGSLEVHRLAIGWGEARLEATATLALDEDLQPMGAGTGKIVGYSAALDTLQANAVLTRSAATAAKAVMSLVGNAPAEGEPEEVEVPLTLQFRTLSVGQVPLVRLPELNWP